MLSISGVIWGEVIVQSELIEVTAIAVHIGKRFIMSTNAAITVSIGLALIGLWELFVSKTEEWRVGVILGWLVPVIIGLSGSSSSPPSSSGSLPLRGQDKYRKKQGDTVGVGGEPEEIVTKGGQSSFKVIFVCVGRVGGSGCKMPSGVNALVLVMLPSDSIIVIKMWLRYM